MMQRLPSALRLHIKRIQPRVDNRYCCVPFHTTYPVREFSGATASKQSTMASNNEGGAWIGAQGPGSLDLRST